jgi:hypothetical protein
LPRSAGVGAHAVEAAAFTVPENVCEPAPTGAAESVIDKVNEYAPVTVGVPVMVIEFVADVIVVVLVVVPLFSTKPAGRAPAVTVQS